MSTLPTVEEIQKNWASARWRGIERPYSAEDIERLRGTAKIEYSLADAGARRLWNLLHTDDYLPALGALTGNPPRKSLGRICPQGHWPARQKNSNSRNDD